MAPGARGRRPAGNPMRQDGAPATVVFDLDGTLIDSAPDLGGALNGVLAELGRPPVAPEAVRKIVGEGAVAMLRWGLEATGGVDGHDPEVLRPRFLEHYGHRIVRETRLFPGVGETLDALDARGCRLAVCTNKPEGLARGVLDGLGQGRRFGALVGCDTLPVRKPDPRAVARAVLEAGGGMERAAMVGDSRTDVLAARNAGIPSVVVSYGYTRVPPSELGADAVVDRFDGLPDVLEDFGILG